MSNCTGKITFITVYRIKDAIKSMEQKKIVELFCAYGKKI
jgi:hypothetical protein